MDEKKLSELFKDVVRDVPPATFGTGEVRRASQRAAVKRRNTVVGASVLAFALVVGGTVTTVALSGGFESPTAANAPAVARGDAPTGGTMERGEGTGPDSVPLTLNEQPPLDPNSRSDLPKQGGTPTGSAGTAGSTPSGCQADRELAAALAGELPAAPTRTGVGVPFGCPQGSRGAAYKVTDGSRTGTISVVLVPEGSAPNAPLGSDVYGTANAASEAGKGGTLHVVSQPDPNVEPAEPPFVDTIARIAADLAPRF
ncbi:hypothetical protein KIPE111705_08630 [Kibdelosporangium persicum]|uniref:DUF5642 domain-containing protein n=1 Tax=Kibdelosporangium persicum TaxID=2698649 RepID=A0ABX2EXQ8_9PSEU|nr:hypothetical protein [Kibdelosporangium persicum]NRN63777.1 hypothetical protein [Kibdelosporangium persicum]